MVSNGIASMCLVLLLSPAALRGRVYQGQKVGGQNGPRSGRLCTEIEMGGIRLEYWAKVDILSSLRVTQGLKIILDLNHLALVYEPCTLLSQLGISAT